VSDWEERLSTELVRMNALCARSEFIEFVAAGEPPDRYTINYSCNGLVRDGDSLRLSDHHSVLVYLHRYYPAVQPQITWITPIFHPNIKGNKVCLGRSWSPALMIDDLALELGAMIQYKTYNVEDPLNKEAARVIEKIMQDPSWKLPIDSRNLLGPLLDFDVVEEAE
jgi:ubiquitin-protein ligase